MTRTPPVPKQSQSPGPRAPLKKQDAPEPAPVQTANIPLAPKDPSILETQVDNWADEGGAGGEVNRARDAAPASPSAHNRHAGKPKPVL